MRQPSGLASRIREVIAMERVPNARQWSVRAGLTPKHVATFLRRSEISPQAVLGRSTLEKLAKAVGVRTIWLESGIGDPEVPHPARETVMSELSLSGVHKNDVKRLYAISDPETDQPAEWWRSEWERIRAGVLENALASAGYTKEAVERSEAARDASPFTQQLAHLADLNEVLKRIDAMRERGGIDENAANNARASVMAMLDAAIARMRRATTGT